MSGPDEKSPVAVNASNRLVRVLSAFVLGGGLLSIYLWHIGLDPMHRAFNHVSSRRLISLLVIGVVPVVFWGSGLHLVFVRFGIAKRFSTSVLLFGASSFLNGVTPFGQAGGDPLSAVLFTRSLRADFETCLAAIGSVNALNRIASLFLGLIGVGYLGTQVAFRQTLEIAAIVTVAMAVIVLGTAAVGWYYRQTLVRWGAVGLARVLEPADRLPGVTPPSCDSLAQRGHRFTEAIARLGDAPGTLGVVFIAGIAGQIAVASTLWVALAALGVNASFAVVLLLIPAAKLSGAVPTPGGFGGAEAVLTALMIATIGIDGAIAAVAALLYRASAFWIPSLGGGIATAWYVVHEPEPSAGDGGTPSVSHSSPAELATGIGEANNLGVSMLLLAVSVALGALLAVGVHRWHLLVEPDSVLVHTTRDSTLFILSFGITWLTLRRGIKKWFG